MKFRNTAIILSLAIFLSACATYPKSRENQAAYHASEARSAISKGDSTYAAHQIDDALNRPRGDAKIKELFASHPKGRDYYWAYLEKSIFDVSSVYSAVAVFEKLSEVKSAGIFSEDQIRELFASLTKVVTDGNTTGSIPFDLGDRIELFPELQSPFHQQIIINRTIKNLQTTGSGRRPVVALMDYVQRIGIDSIEGKRIESLLHTMNIRRDELDVVVNLFPEFAAARKKEITARVYLQVKNGDRLLSDDLLQALRNEVRGIEWVSSDDPTTTTLLIERLRNDERTLPERTETITYAQHEVNLLSAALLMPRNASYLYELVSGGVEIEYGYVVSAVADGKTIFDEVIRGKVSREYRRCQNDRIQNVFGGVKPAGFIANDDMQQRCAGPSSASIDEIRKEVFSKVVDVVLKVPSIKVAHELN
ncbi:hypothetical protein [Desulfococcus sp.]|uniref:hypothetical protein n=1 Tax=Desulfococcus sp. TaxID=2025834 RepID=UPI003592EF4F